MLIRRANSVAGFTMIEAMVTLTVLAILTALSVPTMRTWIVNNKIRGVSDELQNGLRLAQTESLRRSRQVVFALTNTNTPTVIPLGAVANGNSWAIYTVPSMTDGSELPQFIQAGVLSNVTTNVTVISNGTAAVCFNAVGRLVNNATANVTAITGGATCIQPTVGVPVGTPPVQLFNISSVGGDRPLQITLGLGGQVHMCDPNVALTNAHPEGC
jgi:type IV fimbrial biogenesis protein FimT